MKKLFWGSLLFVLLTSCITNESRVDLAVEYYNVGNAFFEIDQLVKAGEYYEKVLKIDPDFHKARYNLIQLQVERSDFKSANKNIEYLKDLDALNLKINELDGYIKYSEGKLEDSLEIYLDVYSQGDVSKEIRLNIVKLYYQLELYDMALSFVDELLSDNEDESLYYLAGLVASGAEDFVLAAHYYESYLGLGGESEDVLLSLLSIYEDKDDYDNIEIILEIIINGKYEDLKAESLFKLAVIVLVQDNDFSLGYEYLVDSVKAGFSDVQLIEGLLVEPDLIEKDKIRQLFINEKILE